jgi:hypothetical protein
MSSDDFMCRFYDTILTVEERSTVPLNSQEMCLLDRIFAKPGTAKALSDYVAKVSLFPIDQSHTEIAIKKASGMVCHRQFTVHELDVDRSACILRRS